MDKLDKGVYAEFLTFGMAQRAASTWFAGTKAAMHQAVHAMRQESRGSAFFRQEECNFIDRAEAASQTSMLTMNGQLVLPSAEYPWPPS